MKKLFTLILLSAFLSVQVVPVFASGNDLISIEKGGDDKKAKKKNKDKSESCCKEMKGETSSCCKAPEADEKKEDKK